MIIPGGGGTPLQEANRDVPLDGAGRIFTTGVTIMGRIFNRFTRMESQIFGFWGQAGIQNGEILG